MESARAINTERVAEWPHTSIGEFW